MGFLRYEVEPAEARPLTFFEGDFQKRTQFVDGTPRPGCCPSLEYRDGEREQVAFPVSITIFVEIFADFFGLELSRFSPDRVLDFDDSLNPLRMGMVGSAWIFWGRLDDPDGWQGSPVLRNPGFPIIAAGHEPGFGEPTPCHPKNPRVHPNGPTRASVILTVDLTMP
jgi:hypothetical protein